MKKTMKYYKSAKGKKSYKKKLKAEIKRSNSRAGLKKRAELKRIRRKALKDGKNIKGKDFDHATGKFICPSKNRGRKGEGGRKSKSKKR